jgi:ribonuclease D
MLVGRSHFDSVLALLSGHTEISADTETQGLRPYHGDRIFSIIMAVRAESGVTPYYFNFLPYEGMGLEEVLGPAHMEKLKALFADPSKFWYFHHAKYDMRMLAQEGIFISGTVHCTTGV